MLPLRVSVTTTLPVGAGREPDVRRAGAAAREVQRRRIHDDGTRPWALPSTVNGISAVAVDSGGDGVVERRGLRRVTAGRECRIGEAVGRAGVGAHESAVDAELHAAHRAVVAGSGRERHRRASGESADRSWGWSGSRWAAYWSVACVPPLQAVPFSVNAVGALLVPLNVPLNPAVKLPTAADALVPLRRCWRWSLRAARGLREGTGQPFCRRCPFGKVEDQRPAVGDGRTVVGDDDVGAEAVTAFPGLRVRDLACRGLRR